MSDAKQKANKAKSEPRGDNEAQETDLSLGGETDDGIVIVDVETLLAEKIPDLGDDLNDGALSPSGDEGIDGKSHSAFADALEDALGNSYDSDDLSKSADGLDPIDGMLKETKVNSNSSLLEPDESGDVADLAESANDDPSVVFGVFPPSYSNMPGGSAASDSLTDNESLTGDGDTGTGTWENRALIAASGDASESAAKQSGGSAFKAGALGLLGGLALVGGAATYAVQNDMVSLQNDKTKATEISVSSSAGKARENSLTPPKMAKPSGTEIRTAKVDPVAPAETLAPKKPVPEKVAPVVVKTPEPVKPEFAVDAGVGVKNVSGFAKDPIVLAITTVNTGDNTNFYIRVKGVPPGAKLSAGLNIGGGIWLLRPSNLSDVQLQVPSYFSGSFELAAELLREDGQTPINNTSKFIVEVQPEQVAAVENTEVEAQAANVVKEIIAADKPKTVVFEPPTDDLDQAPLASVAAGAALDTPPASAENKLAALPSSDVDDTDIEEGMGFLPSDLATNPNALRENGIRPPLRATRAPRRSLLGSSDPSRRQVPAASGPVRTAAVATGRTPASAPTGRLVTRPSTPAVQRKLPDSIPDPLLNTAEQKRLIRQGDRFYKLGDLSSARLFYIRAFESGSFLAAMSVGRTYDPVYFEKLGVQGFQSDPQQALEWYNKAVAGGLALARTKVADLNRWLGR